MNTKELIEKTQEKWAEAVIAIGKSYQANKDYVKLAQEKSLSLYNFENSQVLFKPTRATKLAFRLNEKSALSYFIGGDKDFEEDAGFALEPWEKIRFENVNFYRHEKIILVMGNYYFTDYQGNEVKIEYSFGYEVNDDDLKIVLHHSSVPYKL